MRKVGLLVLAALYALIVTTYCGLWLYSTGVQVAVELGFENQYIRSKKCELVRSVNRNSAAESAGLRSGDQIVALNGQPIESLFSITDVWSRHVPGDKVILTIERPGLGAPMVITGIFRARTSHSREGGLAQDLQKGINNFFFAPFLVVGLAVLFLRFEDYNAWLLALMFGCIIATPNFPNNFLIPYPPLRELAVVYRATFSGLLGALFYFFFAVFPASSPLDRRIPWLKWFGLAFGSATAFPGWSSGSQMMPAAVVKLIGDHAANLIRLGYNYGFIALGLISLTSNSLRLSMPAAHRKIRVILWGTMVGILPIVVLESLRDFFVAKIPSWLNAVCLVLLFFFPLSFAYAVVKHRVLEIPVLLRRGARYLLVQRGFTILLVVLSTAATLLFASSFADYLGTRMTAALPSGIALGTVFGIVLLWTGRKVHQQIGGKIDRAFFRNAYDVRVILEDLAEKIRMATDRKDLAALLERHLHQALQPTAFTAYLENDAGVLSTAWGMPAPQMKTLSASHPLVTALARQGRPILQERQNMQQDSRLLPSSSTECLVPILGRDTRLVGLLAMGARLSEEPYSREDLRLLSVVANQAGLALESIRLGEKVAERITAEQRIAQEMEFAREVQTHLFPQRLPRMETLAYLGKCIPARQVGGDYYDFLELQPGRLALLLADIAGKGVSGALLMANLQANLRCQYTLALNDPRMLLSSVNHFFYQNTDKSAYATLFFAEYDDSTRLLRYINCGHLPPLLLRAGEKSTAPTVCKVERLEPTTTVLGLFETFESEIVEVRLNAGDLLVLYTDGITEAARGTGEEFGESRLVEVVRAHQQLDLLAGMEAIIKAVEAYREGEQEDDITLVVARCRPNSREAMT